MFLNLTVQDLLPSLVALVGALAMMYLLFWVAKRAIRKLADRMEEEDREHIEEIERWAKQLTQFVRRFVEFVAGVAAIFIILRGLGIRGFPELSWEQVVGWLVGPGLRILLVLSGAFVISRVLHLLIARMPLLVIPREGPLVELAERKKRTDTITRMLRTLTSVVVMAIAILIVLRELGVDINPILTGGAIAGLAVGFVAQNLVRDVISGFFLILENQVRVGDVAVINGKSGWVENIHAQGIEIPFPHLSVYMGEASKPFVVQVAESVARGCNPGHPQAAL